MLPRKKNLVPRVGDMLKRNVWFRGQSTKLDKESDFFLLICHMFPASHLAILRFCFFWEVALMQPELSSVKLCKYWLWMISFNLGKWGLWASHQSVGLLRSLQPDTCWWSSILWPIVGVSQFQQCGDLVVQRTCSQWEGCCWPEQHRSPAALVRLWCHWGPVLCDNGDSDMKDGAVFADSSSTMK